MEDFEGGGTDGEVSFLFLERGEFLSVQFDE